MGCYRITDAEARTKANETTNKRQECGAFRTHKRFDIKEIYTLLLNVPYLETNLCKRYKHIIISGLSSSRFFLNCAVNMTHIPTTRRNRIIRVIMPRMMRTVITTVIAIPQRLRAPYLPVLIFDSSFFCRRSRVTITGSTLTSILPHQWICRDGARDRK